MVSFLVALINNSGTTNVFFSMTVYPADMNMKNLCFVKHTYYGKFICGCWEGLQGMLIGVRRLLGLVWTLMRFKPIFLNQGSMET